MTPTARCRAAMLVVAALLLVPAAARAQRAAAASAPQRVRPGVRVDAFLGRDPGAQVAAGAALVAAYNLRVGLDVGGGAVRRRSAWQPTGRVDLLARWLSDPFRESRWAINAGGGVGLQVERGRSPTPVAIVTLGVEGPSDGRWVPGVELGLGGGVRAGLTLRRAPLRRR
jgi:hypothetical protein